MTDKPEIKYDRGDRFLVDDTIDLHMEGDLQQVEVLWAEIDSVSVWEEEGDWHTSITVCHYDPVGDCVKKQSLDVDDVDDAVGDWMEPTDKSHVEMVDDRLDRAQ